LGEGTPRKYVTGENIDDSFNALTQFTKLGSEREFASEGQLFDFIEELAEDSIAKANPSALCSFEMALLDLFSQRQQIPVWKLFTPEPVTQAIHYSSILPLLSPEQRANILKLTRQYKIGQIKAKASNLEETVKVVSEIADTLGPGCDIRLDANEAFTADSAIKMVQALATRGLSISSLEQPLPKKDLDGMKRVQEETGVPVMADESFCNEEDLNEIIKRGCCKGINVRLSKCGGLLNSKKLAEEALKAGLFCQLGCHVGETSILYAAGRHLAAICGPFRFVEGCYSRFLLKEDIVKEPLEFGLNGRAAIPNEPGLGVEINDEALKRHCRLLFEQKKV